jgi:hypothetical protein
VGKCNAPKPGLLDFSGRAKWQAWKNVDNLTQDEAKHAYISLVDQLLPEWKSLPIGEATKSPSEESDVKQENGSEFTIAPSVSRLAHDESSGTDEDDIYSATVRGDIERVIELLESGVDVDACDEDGQRYDGGSCT